MTLKKFGSIENFEEKNIPCLSFGIPAWNTQFLTSMDYLLDDFLSVTKLDQISVESKQLGWW